MKVFSLISGKEVRLAPGRKSIPAAEFSHLCDGLEIIEEARKDAAEFVKETSIEAEKTKEAAFQEGFQEGLVSLNKHLFALDNELKAIREDVKEKILPLVLKASRKIIGDELKLHPDRIVDIILTSLKPVTQHKKIVIYVNKADLALVEESRPKIKKIFEHLENLALQERGDIEPGGCMIETEAGIINASLENQWRALEAAFESFRAK